MYHGKWTSALLEQERKVVEMRAHTLGARSVTVTSRKPDQIVVEAFGIQNPEQAAKQLQTTASLRFYWLPQLGNENGSRRTIWCVSSVPTADGKGKERILADVATRTPVTPAELEQVFSQPPILSNRDLLPKCQALVLPGGYPVVQFELNNESAETFKTFTRHHIGERLAVFLDKKLLTTPSVNGVIKGKGMIEGNLTRESAQAIAGQLNCGALPVPLTLLQRPPLGPESRSLARPTVSYPGNGR